MSFFGSAAYLLKKYCTSKCINAGRRHVSLHQTWEILVTTIRRNLFNTVYVRPNRAHGMNDWCQRHNLVITPGSTSWPSPTAQWRRVPHELWSIPPSPLKALAGSIRLQLQPSFRRDNKDLMQTRTYLRVPVGACVRSESSPPCEDDLTDPHAEGERGRECLRWRLLHSLRELWLMRCTAFSQANASEGCAINLGKRGRPRQYDAFRLAEDNISPWQALPMNN